MTCVYHLVHSTCMSKKPREGDDDDVTPPPAKVAHSDDASCLWRTLLIADIRCRVVRDKLHLDDAYALDLCSHADWEERDLIHRSLPGRAQCHPHHVMLMFPAPGEYDTEAKKKELAYRNWEDTEHRLRMILAVSPIYVDLYTVLTPPWVDIDRATKDSNATLWQSANPPILDRRLYRLIKLNGMAQELDVVPGTGIIKVPPLRAYARQAMLIRQGSVYCRERLGEAYNKEKAEIVELKKALLL